MRTETRSPVVHLTLIHWSLELESWGGVSPWAQRRGRKGAKWWEAALREAGCRLTSGRAQGGAQRWGEKLGDPVLQNNRAVELPCDIQANRARCGKLKIRRALVTSSRGSNQIGGQQAYRQRTECNVAQCSVGCITSQLRAIACNDLARNCSGYAFLKPLLNGAKGHEGRCFPCSSVCGESKEN